MKKILQVLILTLVLSIGFTFPSCERSNLQDLGDLGDCDCSKYYYFDVSGLQLQNFEGEQSNLTEVAPLASVLFDNFFALRIDYIVDYHAQRSPKKNNGFSFINSVYACSCFGGYGGSKTEKLESLSIITLNDFDETHLANSDITDLFNYKGSGQQLIQGTDLTLLQRIEEEKAATGLIQEDLFVSLQKAPELNPEFRVKVKMELSTGEVFEVESSPIFIRE